MSLCYNVANNVHMMTCETCERGALKNLIERGYLKCTTEDLLNEELNYLFKVFPEKNNYPKELLY